MLSWGHLSPGRLVDGTRILDLSSNSASTLATWSNRSFILGRGYLFFNRQLVQLSVVYAHSQRAIFFFTNSIGAPHGEKLGLMNPLLNSFWGWLESPYISDRASLYGALAIGAAPGIKSIPNSTCRFGAIREGLLGICRGSHELPVRLGSS